MHIPAGSFGASSELRFIAKAAATGMLNSCINCCNPIRRCCRTLPSTRKRGSTIGTIFTAADAGRMTLTSSDGIGSGRFREIGSLGPHGEPIVHPLANRNRVYQLRADSAAQGSGTGASQAGSCHQSGSCHLSILHRDDDDACTYFPLGIGSTALASTGKCSTSDKCLWASNRRLTSIPFQSFTPTATHLLPK